MTNSTSPAPNLFWPLVIPAALILMITMGIRQSTGLFVSPLNTTTGLGIASISFAMAIGQFMWGATQPIAGAMADKYGQGKVIVVGILVLSIGTALTTLMKSEFGLIIALGVLAAGGSGMASFSILLGAAAQRLPAASRSSASGFINAGGSVGQFVFAPLAAFLILSLGWQQAMIVLAAISLCALPLVWPLRRQTVPAAAAASATPEGGLKQAIGEAFKDKSYLCLHAGFFTCGFHIAFLVTHLPQEVSLCGLPVNVSANALALIGIANIAGTLIIGKMGNTYRMKYLLFWLYFARAVTILAYLAAPKTAVTFYIFAAALGFTWLATVPPTAGLVGKLFGVRYLATLFGFTLLSHQVGGFLGAWLGGLAIEKMNSYQWMWYADILLALAAAFVNLPISEKKVELKAA